MKEKSEFHAVSLNETSTIVAKFIPSIKDERFYESEASLEAHFIKQLIAQGYNMQVGLKMKRGLF